MKEASFALKYTQVKILLRILSILIILLAFYFLLYKIYIPRVNAFGCFDDCFNFTAGFFINEGKILYKEIFFNHQMLPAFLSSFIQNTTTPLNIFELVLRHRQFVLLFGFLFNFLLFLRFGKRIIPFIFIFELTKFYVFGDRFLAENLVMYPLVYNFNLLWEKFSKRKMFNFDYLLAGIFTWFVIFMREPFIPLAIFLFGLVLYGRNYIKIKLATILIFAGLSFFTLFKVPLSDYYFNVFTINRENFGGEINLIKLPESFFYPIYLFISSEKNIFRLILLSLSSIFIFLVLNFTLEKKYKLIVLIFLVLGLANIRSVLPGRIFYDAFHMVPWYGLFISATFILLFEFKKFFFPFFSILILSFLIFIPNSFLTEKADPHKELIVNYGNFLDTGNAIRTLSSSSDTLFLDGFDELIYWDTKLLSQYKYSWYTSLMPNYKIYSQARLEMFENSLPVFYYGSCKQSLSRILPEKYLPQYQRLYKYNSPSCIFLTKEKISKVSDAQWDKLKNEFNYELKREILTKDNLLTY